MDGGLEYIDVVIGVAVAAAPPTPPAIIFKSLCNAIMPLMFPVA